MQSISEPDRSNALLAHDVVNKLSAIIGLCDLLMEAAEHDGEGAGHLTTILELATAAAAELKDFQRQIAARIQNAKRPQDDVA